MSRCGLCGQAGVRLLLLLPLLLLVGESGGVAIDNSVAAPPDVECLDDRIRVWVHTRKLFAGRIYAKNRAEYPACIQGGYAPLRTKKPHFEVTFGQCGMTSLRSIDPRGMFYSLTIVVSFHPLIITKVDQAFHVKCFFEEANRGLTAELGISMIPTTEVGAHHGIPGCSYSIHQGTIQEVDRGILGPPIQYARVGEKILHRWECADQMFGVLINKCYVTDGFGARAEVVDATGCPLDPILITGIRYAANLTVAFAESHVFKFADKPGVWFFCQIQMCMKGGGMCYGITPPQCSGNVVTTGQGYTPPNQGGAGYQGQQGGGQQGGYQGPSQGGGGYQGQQGGGGGGYQGQQGGGNSGGGGYQGGQPGGGGGSHISGPAQPAPYLPPPTLPRNGPPQSGHGGGGGYAGAAVHAHSETALNSVSELDVPIDLVFESDDVVGAGFEGEPDDPFHFRSSLDEGIQSNSVDDGSSRPRLPPQVMGEDHEDRPFPDDPVLLDSQDLRFLSSADRRSDHGAEEESIEETDGQASRFPVPKVVLPNMKGGMGLGRRQVVHPSLLEPLPPGFDVDSFNETDLTQELNGGLIVYDVDEEAPMFLQRSKSDYSSNSVSGGENETRQTVESVTSCPLNGRNLLILVGAQCGLSGLLGLILWITCLRLTKLRKMSRKGDGESGGMIVTSEDPISSVAAMYREAKAGRSFPSRRGSLVEEEERRGHRRPHRSTSRHHHARR